VNLPSSYKSARKRFGKTAPGRWLKRILKERRDSARDRNEPPLFIVAETGAAGKPDGYFYTEWLAWAAQNDPVLHTRVRLNHLPTELTGKPAAFHAWVQDPVRERSMPVFRQLEDLERGARRRGAHVVQPVAVLSNSLREVQFERLTRAGLRSPRVVEVDADFADDLGGLSLPIVVREDWGHGKPMLRLDSRDEVVAWLGTLAPSAGRHVAMEFIETQSPDGLYRKYRYLLFGDTGVCRHLVFSARWEVRPWDRVLTDDTIAEELRYVSGTCDAHEAFNLARRELEFDIAAFDYSYDESGEIVVWEVNPYPDLSTPSGRPGEYLSESVHRTYLALASFYRDRMALSS